MTVTLAPEGESDRAQRTVTRISGPALRPALRADN
jgi:hypothetical protein